MVFTDIKQISIDELLSSTWRDQFFHALDVIHRVQESLYRMACEDGEGLQQIKFGTILTFATVNKLANGKKLKEFTTEDWEQIAEQVVDKAILLDDQLYSKLVFITYADYIDASAATIEHRVSQGNIDKIRLLSAEIRTKSKALEDGDIEETEYIDDCLWICLEAMLKLMAAYMECITGPELGQFLQAISMYSFEYGRLMLYSKEQEILSGYIENQRKLDEALEKKYRQYIDELEQHSKEFNRLIRCAFDTDFHEKLLASVALAKATGIDDSELLHTVQDVDDFFVQ